MAMDNTFDINRFGNLFTYECRNYLPRMANALITYVCIIFSFWVTMVAAQESMPAVFRTSAIGSIFDIACWIGPFLVYYNANNRKKGYVYAMLPASTFEKFLSMLVMCLFVIPILSYTVLSLADFLFYLVSPQGAFGFKGFELANPFYTEVTVNGSLFGFAGNSFAYLFSISCSMMFNMMLRSAKIIKAILITMAVIFTIMIIAIVVFVNDIDSFARIFSNVSFNSLMLFYDILALSLSLLFLWITYRRIKRVNY